MPNLRRPLARRFGIAVIAGMLAGCGGEVSAPAVVPSVTAGKPASLAQASGPIGSTAAGFEMSDSIAVKVTDGFGSPVAGQVVTFSVVAGGGTVGVPAKSTGADGIARTSWIVGPAGAQTLRATAGALTVDISANAVSCAERTMAVGEVQALASASLTCAVLSGQAQRYVITVANATNSPTSQAGFVLRGRSGATASQFVQPSFASPAVSPAFDDERERTHAELLEKNAEMWRRYGAQALVELRNRSTAMSLHAPVAVGDLVPIKLPNVAVNGCTVFTPITGRVVHVGVKGIILEDTENTLKGQVDTLLVRLGQEFDNVMFPILAKNFGNPLAMDAKLNNDGAMYMVFSNKVNTMGNGLIAGFINEPDYFPNCPSANLAEVFYARAPTFLGGIPSTPQNAWEFTRSIASTIIHEAKHLTSFSAKMAQPGFSNFSDGDAWLEESSAELAQELYERVPYSLVAKGNADYAAALFKEVRPVAYRLPQNMLNAFSWLYRYEADPESFSLVGSTGAGDVTFYGSGWAFLRWVIDTYATSESDFLTAMTRDISHVGVANIENLTGKTFQQLLGEYSVAMALDDYPGFTPLESKYSFPSWNTRSIFAGLNADFPNANPNASPLKVRSSAFGNFTVDVGSVRGGGFSVLEITGAQTSRQLLEFRGQNGAAFSAAMRVNVVRVQ